MAFRARDEAKGRLEDNPRAIMMHAAASVRTGAVRSACNRGGALQGDPSAISNSHEPPRHDP